jgi:hypothetical protein
MGFELTTLVVIGTDCIGTVEPVLSDTPGKCVELYRMSEYSDFILVSRNTLGPEIFVEFTGNSGVRLHKFHCGFKPRCSFIITLSDSTKDGN